LLAFLLCQLLKGIEQILISSLIQTKVSIRVQAEISLLSIPPNLRTDSLPTGLGGGIVETTKGIDEMVPTIQLQPDL